MNRKVITFIFIQIHQIHEGGCPVLFRKLAVLWRKLYAVPLILLAIPIAFLVRLLRTWIIVRFESLHSERIGHFASDTEIYLCERDASMYDWRNFDVFYYDGKISNYQLKKMWNRLLRICPFAKWIDKANRLLPGWQRHVIAISSNRDVHGLFVRNAPHLSFTAKEEQFGQEGLRKIGIPEGNPFVCFTARDSSYLYKTLPSGNRDYHKYRNSDINTYIPATEELTRLGYFTVRMGAILEKRLNATNPRIIDYAVNSRTDFFDIYLGAKCQFFISSTTGIYAIAEIFRRPVAWVDYIPLEFVHTWGGKSVIYSQETLVKERRPFFNLPGNT